MASILRMHILFLSVLLAAMPASALAGEKMRLQIKVADQEATGILEDNPVARQLEALSPLTMEMEDYNGHERIGFPPGKLSTQGARQGWTPKRGDIALFAPWGNLCVFVKNSPFSSGLIYLGNITSGLDILDSQNGKFACRWIISR